jgi:hypothetical protein
MAKKVAALLAIVGILGVLLAVFDKGLQEYAPSHFDVLIVFVLVDFGLAALITAKPNRSSLTLAVVWSVLRIVLQLGDVFLGTSLGFDSNAQFADYLFNPLNSVEGNPPGVPAAIIDLIMLLQLAIVGLGWKTRRAQTAISTRTP